MYQDARAMLTALVEPAEGMLEIRNLPGGSEFFPLSAVLEDDSWPFLETTIDKGRRVNCYFGVATRDGHGGGRANIVNLTAAYTDLDFKQTPPEEIKKRISLFPHRPSIVVMSGGGFHLYWLFDEPLGREDIEGLESVNRRIAYALGGDMAATDAARILRVPGTINQKRGVRVELKHLRDFRYNLEDFADLPEPEPSTASHHPQALGDSMLQAVFACRFMRHAYENQATLSEPLWYAAVSNLARLSPGGITLAHHFSCRHPNYSKNECDQKILHALDGSGPHGCVFIKRNGFRACGGCRATVPLKMIVRQLKGL